MRIANQSFLIKTQEQQAAFISFIKQMPSDQALIVDIREPTKQRTQTQNAALHKWCQQLADALNNAGFSVQTVLSRAVDREFDMPTVKSQIWKPVQLAMLGKESTADADTSEYTKVYETINRHIASNYGIHVPWPSQESLRDQRLLR